MQLSYFLSRSYLPTPKRYIRRHGSLKRVALTFRIPTRIPTSNVTMWIDEFCLLRRYASEWLVRLFLIIIPRISGEMYQRVCCYRRFKITSIVLCTGTDIHSIRPKSLNSMINQSSLSFMLKSGMDPNAKLRSDTFSWYTLLYMAVMYGDMSSCRILLESGADIHAKIGEENPGLNIDYYYPMGNESPLEYAIRFNKTNFIELFRSY